MRGLQGVLMLTILSIAGSDSCAGAGIQIDMKTAAAHGVYATCAITALTAQNTLQVSAVQMTQPEVLRAQIEAVCADMPPAAVKIGMLGTAQTAQVVADALRGLAGVPIVLDPVLVATAGAELTSADAFGVLRGQLVPLATVVTPNLPEAAALAGVDVVDAASSAQAAQAFADMGAKAVLVKGGHGEEDVIVDRLYTQQPDGLSCREFTARRLPGEYHGTGCSLSTAIACNLAAGADVPQAVAAAHAYLASALRHETGLGHGTKVFNPLYRLERA